MTAASEFSSSLQYFESHSQELIEFLEELVRRDTPSGDIDTSREFVEFYGEFLEDCGVRCHQHHTATGVHLVGDWHSPAPPGVNSKTRAPAVTIILHSDTVWPRGEAERRPPFIRDGKLYGPGVYDMKAGLMQAAFFFKYLEECQPETSRDFRIFVSADEETGSKDAHVIMEEEVPLRTYALVLEPPLPNGSMKIERKGVGVYNFVIHGKAAHAGIDPHLGVSAIDELGHQILALQKFRDPEKGVSINIGMVNGGLASNVIADRVEMKVEMRFDSMATGDELDHTLRSLPRHDPAVEIAVDGGIIFPPMVPPEQTIEEAAKVVEIAAGLGLTIGTGRSGGGSDGSFLAARGIVTLDGLGVDGGGAHALDEHVVIDRLAVRTALITEVALHLGAS